MTVSKKDFLRNIAANVSRLCEARGWSVRELARQADESTSTVHRMANGTHEVGSYSTARVAAALEVTVDELQAAPKKSRDLIAV